MALFTRKQYMDNEVDHQTYYAQFATPPVVNFVRSMIGEAAIRASTDEHFNDIPLSRWGGLHESIRAMVGKRINESNNGCGVSRSESTCVAKAAARIIKENP